jgi:hypothetical protein
MELRKFIATTIREYLNEQQMLNDIPKPNNQFLYHGTNIRNLKDIKKFGLIPDFGDTVRGAEMGQYYFDDEYINPDDRVDGIIFFSDNPDTWKYSHFGGTPNINEAVLVIVKKNDTIYRKNGEYIYDINGNKVNSVNYTDIDKLPFFIENGDYFSLDEQEPFDILYGERLIGFLKQFS